MAADDEATPFFYVNAVQLAMGPFDLTIDMGRKRPEDARPGSSDFKREVRVTMSPSHAKSLLTLLASQIAAYESEFGIIPSPHFEKGDQ